ncbi:hypothetical protein SDC9_161027 [bioreactor metagenome]|uniref:Peptidase family U32 C-terminal domain-containing protein n=1 Tax=bioreactor metagenome TaxID=1076179 RepID=A0A645FND6_9ZZZZ
MRNVFTINDELEVFGPKIDNESFIVQSIVNGDNCKIDIANQPMTEVRVPIPFTVYPEDMIRRK